MRLPFWRRRKPGALTIEEQRQLMVDAVDAADLWTGYMIDKGYMLVLSTDADMRPKTVRNTDAGLRWLADTSIDHRAEIDQWARERGRLD